LKSFSRNHRAKETSMKNQSTSIGMSIPSWIIEMVDSFRAGKGKNRSHFASQGMLDQMIMEMRGDVFFEHLSNALGEDIDRADREEITISVPVGFADMIRQHCDRCCYDENSFYDLAISRFIVMKDKTPAFFKSIADSQDGYFPTVIN